MTEPDHSQALPMHVADAICTASVGGALMGWLPPVAALFAIAWYALQIWESRTVQGWRRRRREG